MAPRVGWSGAGFAAVLLGSGVWIGTQIGAVAADDPAVAPKPVPAAKAVEPPAPALPGELLAALQEGRADDARAILDRLDPQAKPEDRPFLALIRGVSERLAGRPEPARAALAAAIEADPDGPWAAKLRYELATVELAAGQFARAEALARVEAQSLLDDDRKDGLAKVYDAFARRLLAPDDPMTPADPEGAYALLEQARALARGEPLRARLLAEMGRASQAANNQSRAIDNYQAYLREHPKGEERADIRFRLGQAQFDVGQREQARRTWGDLARDLEGQPDRAEVRARALYQVALTHNIPAPDNDAQLGLGVAALRRFLEAAPAHPLSVKAAYQIGQAYLARGRSHEALATLNAFLEGKGFRAETEAARKDLADLSMAATFLVGQVLQGQGRFAPAIEAWKGYLARFPNGPQSAEAQRAILDTELAIAREHVRLERFDEARAAFEAFVTRNPLDARVPEVLFEIGQTFATQKQFDAAIAAWETLNGKFPGSEPAARAQFAIAGVLETEQGDLAGAIERFRKVQAEPWASQARQRIVVMEAKALEVVTPRAFRSGETARLKIRTRNLETLTFTAYKLNPEAYFRKKHALSDVESLDIGLVAPDAEWTQPVTGYARYKPVEAEYELPKLEVPGVYVVKVSDEKALQATTLVLGSDLDAIVKSSGQQLLVYAQDMKTGKGRAGARVLVTDGEAVILEAKTGDDGVLLASWDEPREPGDDFQYLVIDGRDVAGSGLELPGSVAQGLTPRAYLDTDRPAYRPGQEVALRGVVREVEDGQYASPKGETYRLEVSDSRGRQILSRPVVLSEFGTFHDRLTLDSAAPVGSYRIRLHRPGKSEFAGGFEVQAYKLEKLDLAFEFPRTVYFRGESVRGELVARYQFGAPAAGRSVVVALPDGRNLSGVTDPAGKFAVAFDTDLFDEERPLRLVAQLVEDNVAAAANLRLAVRAFSIDLSTPREVYLDGESFTLRATTLDAQGEPTGQKLSVAVLKRVEQGGQVAEREVSRTTLETDPKTGQGRVTLLVEDGEGDGGSFVVRAAATDRLGNPIVADRPLTISGRKDETKLRILTDRQNFKVGETAEVNLHARAKPGPALLAWEADRVLSYRIVELKEGDNPVSWAVEGPQFPNFTLTAARMTDERFDEARLDVRVERDLRVTLTPVHPTVAPGEPVEVEVTAVDQLGKPVRAELSLALVDRALLRLHGDKLPPIDRFFYDQSRVGAFATESTNPFRYEAETQPVPEAVVEEQARAAALALDGRRLATARDQAVELFAAPAPAPAAMPGMMTPQGAAGRPDVRGGMMGMMGGMGGEKAGMGFGVAESDFALKEQESDQLSQEGVQRKARVLGRGLALDGMMQAAPQPREQFVETAYWNPAVVTGADGKARVTFPAPSALSEYELKARGVTGSDTLVGQQTAGLSVRKPFFVELRAPAIVTQGDAPRFLGRLHHVGVAGTAEVSLSIYAGGRESVDPRRVELKGDGVEEILFEPFEVPEGESVRLTLTARVGEATDSLLVEVPIRPWGVRATASASGTSGDDATVIVGLPAGRSYENLEMIVALSPGLRRLLIELALGRDFFILSPRAARCIFPPPPSTTADRASDLLAAASALAYLKQAGGADAPEAGRLADRIRGLVGELITLQNDDGGWPWVVGGDTQSGPSDRLASARALWALASADPHGLVADPGVFDRATGFLAGQLGQVAPADHEARAAILHALSTRKMASFEAANSLNRLRQSLPDAALAYLALTLANLERPNLAGEVLDVLGPRAKSEPAAPGSKPRTYWEGANQHHHRGRVETTALAALAFARARPQAPQVSGAAEWLLAHREGTGWNPNAARGAAVAALTRALGSAGAAEDRYRLVVTVNDEEVHRAEVNGPAEGQLIAVPARALKAGDGNRVRFDIEGRGTFGYAVTLAGFTREFGPDQDRTGKPNLIERRVYFPAAPELDGKPLPTGFGAAVNPVTFENTISQLARGGRARVEIHASRHQFDGQQPWERDYLVVEEHLPAGATLVEGSVATQAQAYEVGDGTITFYFGPDQYPGQMSYEVFGYLPGRYRALPARIRGAYDPEPSHLGAPGDLKVLAPGETSTDPYRQTPDELLARGKALFEAGKVVEAAVPLEALSAGYTLHPAVAREVARMLLAAHIKDYQPRKIVQDFEILKEKAPDLLIPFDEILVVGRAYRDINEHERAYLVWKAIIEASYLEDARVGELLRQRGRTLEGLANLIDLWRAYPDTASIESDFFGLSQVLATQAGRAIDDPALRKELTEAGLGRADLLLQSIRIIQTFLALSPKNPLADEASLALVGAYLDLEDFESVVRLAERFARLYPKSTFLDGFQFSEALGRFQLGQYDRAIATAETIAAATYKDANGVEQPSPNKWQAIYILGQIHDARRQPAKALEYYEQVDDRFTDAAGAVKALTRKDLSLPEVSVIRPREKAAAVPADPARRAVQAIQPALFRNVGVGRAEGDPVELGFRNIAEVDVTVYPVDLMRLYLTRRNLDAIAGIDLAGITPRFETKLVLGDGQDFADRTRELDLPLDKEGAYLVMVRGENRYASGIALVTPLRLEVLEEADAGRVRIRVVDARTGDPVPKVQVKVIGSDNPAFLSGQTDLRGVFVAEGVRGQVTAVARHGAGQYAFHRGTAYVGQRAVPEASKPGQPGHENAPAAEPQSLDQNLKDLNMMNRSRQIERLEGRYGGQLAPGVQVQEAR